MLLLRHRLVVSPNPFVSIGGKQRTCLWAKVKPLTRCKKLNVKNNRPVTCNSREQSCNGDTDVTSAAPISCTDNLKQFSSNTGLQRTYAWVAARSFQRCKKLNVKDSCPATCGNAGCDTGILEYRSLFDHLDTATT